MHDFNYYDALGVTYEVQDYIDLVEYDPYSLELFAQAKTLEVIEFLESHQIKSPNPIQNTFARLLDLALAN